MCSFAWTRRKFIGIVFIVEAMQYGPILRVTVSIGSNAVRDS